MDNDVANLSYKALLAAERGIYSQVLFVFLFAFLRRSFRNSVRIEASVSVLSKALDPAINKLKLVKIFSLHRLEAFLAPRAGQVVLGDLHRRRRGVPVQQPQHVDSGHECHVFRAHPEAKQAWRNGAQGVGVAVSPKPGLGKGLRYGYNVGAAHEMPQKTVHIRR